MNGMENDASLSVRLPPNLIWRIGQIAADLGLPTTELVRTAILKGLDQMEMQSGAGLRAPVSAPPQNMPPQDTASADDLGGIG